LLRQRLRLVEEFAELGAAAVQMPADGDCRAPEKIRDLTS
jgi:hypothetical protein